MEVVKIFLRSILQDKKSKVALFDTNRGGGIDDLVTEVVAGSTVIWKPDYRSGIKEITRVYAKEGKGDFFGEFPRKMVLGRGVALKTPDDVKGEVVYGIDYIACDGRKLSVDPILKMIPPGP
ncbi:MAG: hypothetical protein ACOC31_00915 [Bacteroidota bacterium]